MIREERSLARRLARSVLSHHGTTLGPAWEEEAERLEEWIIEEVRLYLDALGLEEKA